MKQFKWVNKSMSEHGDRERNLSWAMDTKSPSNSSNNRHKKMATNKETAADRVSRSVNW